MMRLVAFMLAAILALTLVTVGNPAQSAREVLPATASEHLARRVEPVYPEIAKAMRLQGKVTLKVIVTEAGEVDSAKLVSGPPPLVQAAIDAVKQWRYKPFVADGNPTRATFQIEVPFSLGIPEDQQNLEQEMNQTFVEREHECRRLLKAQEYAASEVPCMSLVDLAEKLPKEQQLERMEANQLAGRSLFGERKFPQALGFFQHAVTIAEATLHPTNAELGQAYLFVARGYHLTGDLEKAATFYGQAETTLRKAREHMSDDEFFKNEYAKQIHAVLIDYIVLLHQAGQEDLASQAQGRADAITKEIHE